MARAVYPCRNADRSEASPVEEGLPRNRGTPRTEVRPGRMS
jgi:hypothetical protein